MGGGTNNGHEQGGAKLCSGHDKDDHKCAEHGDRTARPDHTDTHRRIAMLLPRKPKVHSTVSMSIIVKVPGLISW